MKYLVNEKRLQKMKDILFKRQDSLRVFLDNVYSNHNLSAIVRSCDAVNIGKLYYRHQKDVKLNDNITMGSHKWIFTEYVCDIENFYNNMQEYQIVVTSLDEDSVDFREIDYTKHTLIVMGNEVEGVSKTSLKYATHKITIPMYGMSESLNVSVSTAIILYEAERQRKLKGMYDKMSIDKKIYQNSLKKWAYDDIIAKELKRPRMYQYSDGSIRWLNQKKDKNV